MKAIGKYIMVEDVSTNIKKTKGGFEIAESQDNIRYRDAIIFSAGIEYDAFKEGDKIVYDSTSRGDVIYEGKTYKVITVDNIVFKY